MLPRSQSRGHNGAATHADTEGDSASYPCRRLIEPSPITECSYLLLKGKGEELPSPLVPWSGREQVAFLSPARRARYPHSRSALDVLFVIITRVLNPCDGCDERAFAIDVRGIEETL